MPVFKPGTTVETREPAVIVEAGLEPGAYRFRLVVVNERGVASQPAEFTVTVLKPTRGAAGPPVATDGCTAMNGACY